MWLIWLCFLSSVNCLLLVRFGDNHWICPLPRRTSRLYIYITALRGSITYTLLAGYSKVRNILAVFKTEYYWIVGCNLDISPTSIFLPTGWFNTWKWRLQKNLSILYAIKDVVNFLHMRQMSHTVSFFLVECNHICCLFSIKQNRSYVANVLRLQQILHIHCWHHSFF